MGIKVVFTTGASSVSVGGLFQWDYGQMLEIECAEIGSEIMEVHFACRGMSEAIVRSCSFSNGVGTVAIPDQCLEQAEPITAWIYSISGTQGRTIKTITLPISARIRPSTSRDVPAEYINLYGEALDEINEAVNKLENGDVTAAKAKHAVNADSATTAMNAGSASYATSAGSATTAGKALELSFNLLATAKVTDGYADGEDGLPAGVLMKNCVYFVKFYQTSGGATYGSTYSGIFVYNPQAYTTSINFDGYYAAQIEGTWISIGSYTSGSWASKSLSGFFYLYKIGTLPEEAAS